MSPTHVIIDTDPGIDDTFALLVALARSDDIIIDALTIVMGNHSNVDILAENACRILSWCGRSDIPVICGARQPMNRPFTGESGIKVHGQDGFGNICESMGPCDLSPLKKYPDTSAADFIVDHCNRSASVDSKVSIITLGPLTNLALAVEKDPELTKKVQAVYTMGGAVNVRGNKTPMAEANFHNDPEAARIVCTAGFDLTLTALNVTRQLELSDSFRKSLQEECGTLGRVLHDASHHYVTLLRGWGNEVIPIHDPTAVISLLRPDLFESKEVHCEVETKGELTSGVVIADWMGHYGEKESVVRVLTKVDEKAYMQYFKESLQQAAAIVDKVGSLTYAPTGSCGGCVV